MYEVPVWFHWFIQFQLSPIYRAVLLCSICKGTQLWFMQRGLLYWQCKTLCVSWGWWVQFIMCGRRQGAWEVQFRLSLVWRGGTEIMRHGRGSICYVCRGQGGFKRFNSSCHPSTCTVQCYTLPLAMVTKSDLIMILLLQAASLALSGCTNQCDCNPDGTIPGEAHVCTSLGGQCRCKANVQVEFLYILLSNLHPNNIQIDLEQVNT